MWMPRVVRLAPSGLLLLWSRRHLKEWKGAKPKRPTVKRPVNDLITTAT